MSAGKYQVGGGGGGRISVHYQDKQFKGQYQAYGGNSQVAPGGPGTVTEVKTGTNGATYLFVDAGYLYAVQVSHSDYTNCRVTPVTLAINIDRRIY